MTKQNQAPSDKSNQSDTKNTSDKQSGAQDNAGKADQNLDPQSEFAVNELREEKRDAE